MFTKVLRNALGLSATILILAAAAAAQTAQVEGTVRVKAADGTLKPVPGALVEIHRRDIKGKYDVKTDKTGHYVRLGIPLQGNYTFVFSGPGCQPTWLNNVRVSQQPVVDMTLEAGEGQTVTLEQIMAADAQQKAGGKGTVPTTAAPDRAKAEAENKENLAKAEESKALQANFDAARTHYNTGVETLKSPQPNLQLALSEFEQAIQVDPTKHDAMRDLAYKANANLAETHYQIGVELFNTKKKDEAKGHFTKAVDAIRRSILIASEVKPETNANLNNDMLVYYGIFSKNAALLVEYYGAADLVDEAIKNLEKAQALDAANKMKWEVQKGNLYRGAGRTDEAVAVYKGVLAADPKNLDALYFLGIALLGSPEKEKIQESVNSLAAFVDAAPATDKRVPDAKTTIEMIRNQFKIEAEKPATRRGRRP
jgi:tetratricopeptide (TPR) repeat protein